MKPLGQSPSQVADGLRSRLDVGSVRGDFPILDREVNGHPLVYFDNAATAQTPRHVVDAISSYYYEVNSNVHRGVHTLSQEATDAYEEARNEVAAFLNAASANEIVFTAGTTDSINRVASALLQDGLGPEDDIVVTEIEHHSNFVPWQVACERSGARLVIVEASEEGWIDPEALRSALSPRTRLVAITHVSNTLGSVVDLQAVVRQAREFGALVLSDGAQSVPHMPVDVQGLGVDFYAFSGHKLFGPMGIGVLYGREDLLSAFEPMVTGGGMIDVVSRDRTTWADLPHRHEAGTPNVSGAIGLAAAMRYVTDLGFGAIEHHEALLSARLADGLGSIPNIRLFGPEGEKASVFSFAVGSAHPYDAGSLLDQLGFAVRTGHHCNQPLMDRLGIPGTVRASLAFYNTADEVDRFVSALERVNAMLN